MFSFIKGIRCLVLGVRDNFSSLRSNYASQCSPQTIRAVAVILRIVTLFTLSQTFIFTTNAQIGTWRTHFNYLNTKDLAIVEDKVYCISENGFFYYDIAEKQAFKLSKLDGFAETGIALIGYNSPQKTILITYQSGNIDLLKVNDKGEPTKIANIPLLKETTAIQGNKQANHIEFNNKIAYIAYDFGLVVLDIEKQDIRETYQNLGNDGFPINIFKTVITPDSIYLSTSQGIRVAKFASNINLQFFGNWKTLINKNLAISNFQNGLIVASDTGVVYGYKSGKYSGIIKFSEKIENIEMINNQEYFIKSLSSINILNIINSKINKINENVIQSPRKLKSDAQGKYWIADFKNGLLSNREGIYKSFSPSSLDTLYQTRRDSSVLDADGNRWSRRGDFGGIVVENTKKQRKFVSTGIGSGNLPSENVRSLALDRDGQMWVGTDRGVVVFDNPSLVFSGKNFDAYTPVFERRRLLGNETVSAIAIDGGNRKWMGTRNGIFLFSPDGTELVTNFNEKNSPLPTNEITYITTEPNTGEVYIRTPKGMVSYRGTATEGGLKQDESTVKVFPNPIRPDFEGQIGIEGLVENAFVKITDVVGNLVYETRANGGIAVWNGRTLMGGRVETGIYLIFSGNAKGEETLVSRLAVVK